MQQTTVETRSPLRSYLWVVLAVMLLGVVAYGLGDQILERLGALKETPTAPELGALVLFGLCSFISFYATRGTPLPSFVVAIALGVAGHPLFAPIVGNPPALGSLVTASAALILFSGGLEMALPDFLRLSPKIVLLAFPGMLLTAFALSGALGGLGTALGIALAPAVVILLGAVLCSTDPSAIILVLQGVRFKRPDPKAIVIAESALNDVVGTLLTSVFLKLSLITLSLAAAYRALATAATGVLLVQEIGFGFLFGIGGYLLLWFLTRWKRGHSARYGVDHVYFLATPILAFVGASAFGGSGFLAAFIAGLLFHVESHLQEVEQFFSHVIEGVAKPVIFLLVGALVNVQALLAYAPIGIAAALIFMVVIRPAMVFITLGVFGALPKDRGGLSAAGAAVHLLRPRDRRDPGGAAGHRGGEPDHAGQRSGGDRHVGDPADADHRPAPDARVARRLGVAA